MTNGCDGMNVELFQQFFSLVYIVNGILAGVLIFLERRNAASTWAWLMVLLFLPGAGFILYILFGQKLSGRKLYKLKKGEFSRFLAFVMRQKRQLRNGTMVFNDNDLMQYQDLIHMNIVNDDAWFTQDNGVTIYHDGNEKFRALFEDIRCASNHIHLLYFIIRDDALGRKLVQLLAEKARDGVEVRVLYDAVGSRLRKSFFNELTQAGGQVAAFFPTRFMSVNIWVNFRNHRKIAVIDGQAGYIGGINFGMEYMGQGPLGYWRDTHLRIKGSAVHMLQARFFLDWNLSSKKRMEEERQYFPPLSAGGTTGIQIVSSGPNSDKQQIKHAYLKMIYKAKKQICLQTPYFIPDESILSALKAAAMSGIEVKIMIPAVPDHKLVYMASYSYLGDILRSGIQCYLYEKGFLHSKLIIVDDQAASVGSANIDNRSFEINFESNAIIYGSATAHKLLALFEEDLQHCREMKLEEYNRRPMFRKLLESLIRLLSPIL